MSRTIAEIYQEIATYKDTQVPIQTLAPLNDTEQNLLTDLNSTSKVAIWRIWAYLTATAIWTHEQLWNIFRIEIETKANAAITGTLRWYHAQALAFQYTDNLVYDANTGKYGYAILDATKRIVNQCSIEERADGVLHVKVAKSTPTGLVGLVAAEQAAFVSYFKKIRFAGTQVLVFSGQGDAIKIRYDIYYDPIVPLSTIQNKVETAITTYINTLPFDAEFMNTRLTDALQAIDGVKDPREQSISVLNLSANLYEPINRSHKPQYGYYRISPIDPLSSTINYIAI